MIIIFQSNLRKFESHKQWKEFYSNNSIVNTPYLDIEWTIELQNMKLVQIIGVAMKTNIEKPNIEYRTVS